MEIKTNRKFFSKFAFFMTLLLLSLFLSACMNDMDSMVENYNSKFNISERPFGENRTDPNINDDDYKEGMMIPDTYIMHSNIDNYTITFSAPEGGKEYNWQWGEVTKENITKHHFLSNQRTFSVTMKDIPEWKEGCVYIIYLSVVNQNDIYLHDSAYVSVVDKKITEG